MAKTKWVVRILKHYVFKEDEISETFLECLRRAGLVVNHNERVFDLKPPHGVDELTWAQQTAERMSSFGYNAKRAPAWLSGEETPNG